MQKILFTVKSRPSNAKPGRTNVVNRITVDGVATDTIIGKLRKARGSDGALTAFVLNTDGSRTQLDGTFSTRSGAGHAVQRAFYADERAAKVAARETVAKAKAAAAAKRAQAKADKAAA